MAMSTTNSSDNKDPRRSSTGLIETIRVPTIFTKPTKKIDVHHLNTNELESIEKEDPFLYHSIPTVHRADPSSSLPLHLLRTSNGNESSVVTRKSCISAERHVSVLFEEIMHGLKEDDDDSSVLKSK
eukprot:scaffold2151_cov178-Alexandrium_tamarense.AAC.12